MSLGADAQTLEQTAGVGLRFPAAQLGKLCLQIGGPQTIFIGKVGLFVDGVLFLHYIIQVLVAHDNGVKNGKFIVGILVLLQNGHPFGGVYIHAAGGGIQFTGKDPQEGGFARAVGTDDAVAVAGQELQVYMLEQPLAAELHTQIADCDH